MTIRTSLGLAAAALFAASYAKPAFAAENVNASYTAQQLNATTYRYDFSLQDTAGSADVATFWYAWVPGYNMLTVAPTNVLAPSGWNARVDNTGIYGGYSVEWTVTSPPTGDITAGQTLSGFQFDSIETPAQLLGSSTVFPGYPVNYSYTYANSAPNGQLPGGDGGFFLSPTQTVIVPEPASLTLLAVGAAMLMGRRRGRSAV